MNYLKFFHIFLLHIQSFYEKTPTKTLQEIFSAMFGRATSQNDPPFQWSQTRLDCFGATSTEHWESFPQALFNRKISRYSLQNDQWIIKCLFINIIEKCHLPTPATKRYTLQKTESLSFCHENDRKEDWKWSEITVIKSKGLEREENHNSKYSFKCFVLMHLA